MSNFVSPPLQIRVVLFFNISLMIKRKVILYIAMSLDGYIATLDGDISFLSSVEKEGEDYGYEDFIKTVDTVILGRKTYEKVLSFGLPFPHANKETYVITHQERASKGSINFYNGELSALIQKLKQTEGGNIFVDGGAQIVNEMLRGNLIDECIISTIPHFLGEGILLFQTGRPQHPLKLLSSKAFETGLIQLHYQLLI